MEDGYAIIDTIVLLVGLVLILFTGMRVSSRRRSGKKPMKGQRAATIGMLIWLGLLAAALYMIFG